MENLKLNRSALIVVSLLYIVIGILFCAFRDTMLGVLFTIVGALVIVAGIVSIVRKNVLVGVIEIVVGILTITLGWFFWDILVVILGAVVVIKSIMELIDGIKEKAGGKIAFAILGIILGGLLIAAPWTGNAIISIFFIVIGALFIVTGAVMMVTALSADKKK